MVGFRTRITGRLSSWVILAEGGSLSKPIPVNKSVR